MCQINQSSRICSLNLGILYIYMFFSPIFHDLKKQCKFFYCGLFNYQKNVTNYMALLCTTMRQLKHSFTTCPFNFRQTHVVCIRWIVYFFSIFIMVSLQHIIFSKLIVKSIKKTFSFKCDCHYLLSMCNSMDQTFALQLTQLAVEMIKESCTVLIVIFCNSIQK